MRRKACLSNLPPKRWCFLHQLQHSTGPSMGSTSGRAEHHAATTAKQPLEELLVWYLGDLGFPSTACAATPVLSASHTISTSVEEKRKKNHVWLVVLPGRSASPLEQGYLSRVPCPAWMATAQPESQNTNADKQWLPSSIYACRQRHRSTCPLSPKHVCVSLAGMKLYDEEFRVRCVNKMPKGSPATKTPFQRHR